MLELIAAAAFFTGIHLLVSGTSLRDRLVRRLGERLYVAGFSLASAVGLAALIYAYGQVREPQVTGLLAWRGVAAGGMFVALALIVFGVGSRGPTAVGGRSPSEGDDDPARGIHRITRHPMLWGFMVWAAIHMAFNPQPVSLIFFGAFLLTAAVGTVSIDAKRRRQWGSRWQRYEARTSNLPFAAIVQGRNRLVLRELSPVLLGIAVAVYVALALFHARLFGLPVL